MRTSFVLHCPDTRWTLYSFPTRRSSDLSIGPRSTRTVTTLPVRDPETTARGRSPMIMPDPQYVPVARKVPSSPRDRKSTRLNSSHVKISYAVFCLIKKDGYRSVMEYGEY